MGSPKKLNKPVEDPANEKCLDRISNLPDELLGDVLSLLPTRFAVSTSVLSRRWRYLFTLTTSLSFEDTSYFGLIDEKEWNRFKKFVYKVLELHQVSPIKKFSLVCRGVNYTSDLNSWVTTAVQKGVQDLHYQVVVLEDYQLPVELLMCGTLERLNIKNNLDRLNDKISFKVPFAPQLSSLKILHLDSVRFFKNDSVERLFSGCELLEELTLRDCKCNRGCRVIISNGLLKILTITDCSFAKGLFVIDAPNLANLFYSGNSGVKFVPLWKYSDSLAKSVLEFGYQGKITPDSLRYDRDLLEAAAYKVTKLYLGMNSVELLLTAVDHEKMPKFQNLVKLHLHDCPFNAWKHVTSLLDKSPLLETVAFLTGFNRCDSDPDLPPHEALIPFSSNVKVIEVYDFCFNEYSLLYMGHLLRNAGILKRVILHKCHPFDSEEELRVNTELLMLPRASKDCCIELVYEKPRDY